LGSAENLSQSSQVFFLHAVIMPSTKPPGILEKGKATSAQNAAISLPSRAAGMPSVHPNL
jgi:hypothetical protein